MDNNKVRGVLLVVLLLVFLCFSFFPMTNGDNNDNEEKELEEQKKSPEEGFWLWQRLKGAYSIYSAIFTPKSIRTYWNLFKAFINYAYTRLFPPNIDFRRGGDEREAVARENGAGEQLKEAIAKSLGTSKAAMEDAAKSAADIAGETMNKAKQKVFLKRTTSSSSQDTTHNNNNMHTQRPNEL